MKKLFAFLALVALATLSFAQLENFVDSTKDAFSTGSFDNFVTRGESIAGAPFGWIWERNAQGGGTCEASTGSIADAPTNWLGPSVAALMLVVLIAAMLYMVSQLMQMPNLSSAAKDLLVEAVFTALSISFLVASLSALGGWYTISASAPLNDPVYSATDPNSGQRTMIDGAMAYARLIIFQTSQDYSMLLIYNTILHTIYSATMWFGVTWRAMYSFNLGPALRPIVDLVGFVLQFLGAAIGEWILHLITLCLIKKWSVSLLLPMAVLLRALPPTRTAGYAITSLIFALSIIYPLMFLIDYEVYKVTKGSLVDSKSAIGAFVQDSGIAGVGMVLIGIAILLGGAIFPFFVGGALSVALELVRNAVYYVVIISLLLPFFNIFVTLTAAKELARFFNVEVNFMAFTKLI